MVTTTNLLSYHKLDESTGQAIDAHGSFDLTVSGATQNVSGKINTAYSFDGTNDLLKNPLLYVGSVFSASFWVKKANAADECAINFGNSISAGQFFAVDPFYNTNKVWVFFGNGNVSSSSTAINNGSFHHVVVTKAGNTHGATIIYVDGVDVTAATTKPTNTITLGSGVTVGNRNAGVFHFDGTLDEIGIWKDEVLSSTSVGELYNSGLGLAYPFAAGGSDFLSSLTDAINWTDSIGSVLGFGRTLSENIAYTDSYSKLSIFNREISNEQTNADSISTASIYNRTATDSISFSDNLVVTNEFITSLSETLDLDDSTAKGIGKTVLETLNLTDSPSAKSEFLASLSETFALADSLQRQLSYNKSISDTLTLADVLASDGGANFLESLAETLNIADSLARTQTANINLTDTQTATDSPLTTKEIFKILTDTMALTDTLSVAGDLVRLVSRLFKLREGKRITLRA